MSSLVILAALVLRYHAEKQTQINGGKDPTQRLLSAWVNVQMDL